MRFGPLSITGGERRLNVAITRAKYNIKLIGSIMPTDIDTDRISQEGPKLLKKYIEFAMNGPGELLNDAGVNDNMELDSHFESSVYNFLESQGYKVESQIGCSGYKINLGVKHPKYNKMFVIGIECDGATYRSSRTARERDRLRQSVLENMGWKIYRIWSTDWIKDTASEKNRLIKAVEDAISSFDIEKYNAPKNTSINAAEQFSETDSLIQFEDKKIEEPNYGFEEYKVFEPKGKIGEQNYVVLSSYVQEVVEKESPVHFDVVCQRVCGLMGRQKVTTLVQSGVRTSLQYLKGKIVTRDDFFYMAKEPNPTKIRKAGPRSVNHIAIDELAMGMCKVIENNIGLTVDELVKETSKAFGFTRSGNNITERMNETVRLLTENKTIEVKDGKVIYLR